MKKMHINNIDVKSLGRIDKNKDYLPLKDYVNIAERLISKLSKDKNSWVLQDLDIISHVVERLVIADSTYNPEKGTSLTTWRYHCVRFLIRSLMTRPKDRGKYYSKPLVTSAIKTSINEYFLEVQDAYNRELLEDIISKATLNESQVKCIRLRLQGKKYREIGKEMGVTKQRVEQILSESIRRMKQVPIWDSI